MQAVFQLTLTGVVQGVGFRPFVYRLAQKNGLRGTVCNNQNGVQIRLQASRAEAQEFLMQLLRKPPPAARILDYRLEQAPAATFPDFRIITSDENGHPRLPLTPDTAPCLHCQQEMQTPQNRRFGYPFTTCTYCGPRYALTVDFPFERRHTSLKDFPMCPVCQQEYQNPEHHRFHSQTNTCPTCGISVWLHEAGQKTTENPILEAVKRLKEGKVVAVRSTSGYLLCADPRRSDTLSALRQHKKRPDKPFALLYPSLKHLKEDFSPTQAQLDVLCSAVAPIVLLTAQPEKLPFAAAQVAPRLGEFGVMLPASSLLFLLSQAMGVPLVATSGNRHGSPILATPESAHSHLDGLADAFLEHNLPIRFPQDDSVMRFAGEQPILLRRARGLAPNYSRPLPVSAPVLAMGADLKSTFLLATGSYAYLSPYFGNLESYAVQERYEQTIREYLRLFGTLPQVVLADAHPQYQSHQTGRALATEWGARFQTVPHHEAHLYSLLAEHELLESTQKTLGVVWDGTGLGTDGAIWGGEFFIYTAEAGAVRTNHWAYFPWLANDKMAREPRLSLLSLSEDTPDELSEKFSATELRLYLQLRERAAVKTSSVGRLFDAVGSLLGCGDQNSFEGQTALYLETLATRYTGTAPDLLADVSYTTIPGKTLVARLREEQRAGGDPEALAAAFHRTLVGVMIREALSQQVGQLACSGGVFQNALLVRMLQAETQAHGIKLYLHKELSPNDENMALGQLTYWQMLG